MAIAEKPDRVRRNKKELYENCYIEILVGEFPGDKSTKQLLAKQKTKGTNC